jgi:hypothetical protein
MRRLQRAAGELMPVKPSPLKVTAESMPANNVIPHNPDQLLDQ